MVATSDKQTQREVAQRASELYERNIKLLVEPQHDGEYLVIDVDSGGYEMDADEVTIMLRAAKRFPNGRRYGMRVGYPAMGYIAGYARPSTPMRLVAE